MKCVKTDFGQLWIQLLNFSHCINRRVHFITINISKHLKAKIFPARASHKIHKITISMMLDHIEKVWVMLVVQHLVLQGCAGVDAVWWIAAGVVPSNITMLSYSNDTLAQLSNIPGSLDLAIICPLQLRGINLKDHTSNHCAEKLLLSVARNGRILPMLCGERKYIFFLVPSSNLTHRPSMDTWHPGYTPIINYHFLTHAPKMAAIFNHFPPFCTAKSLVAVV